MRITSMHSHTQLLKMGASTLAIAIGLCVSPANANPSGTVYTANEGENSVSQVQLATGQQTKIALTIAPHNVQVSPDGAWLLIVGMAGHGAHQHGAKASQGQLLVLNTSTPQSPALALPAGAHPAHVVTNRTGSLAFVTDSAANLVRVFDLATHQQTSTITTGKFPHGLRLSPDGTTLYVANMQGHSVTVIDVQTQRETKRIAVGKAPVQVGFSPDGRLAYVSLSATGHLGIIDTVQQRLVHTVRVGRTPVQMVATPDGRWVYVANQGSAKAPDDRVSVVDPVAAKVVATVHTGKGAHGVAMSADGAYAFITNTQAGTFSVIEVASQKVVATHTVGAQPNGISFQAP